MTGFTTTILHSDRQSPIEHGAFHKPIHANVAFEYGDTHELAEVFQGKSSGYTYARQVNPTVTALAEKITRLENGKDTLCFASGMAAIGTALLSLLRTGDHFISSRFLFGNTNSLLNHLQSFGIEVSFVDATDINEVENAIEANTKLVFVETIANPRTQIAALEEIAALCGKKDLIYVVDNTTTSPYLFPAIQFGAHFVVNSLTKYICGHGNALGGALTDAGNFDWSSFDNIYDTYRKGDPSGWGMTQIGKKGLRDMGGSLSADSANKIAMGAETLALRLERQCSNALKLTRFLDQHQLVDTVYYPGLEHHPQYERAKRLFKHPGALFSFELSKTVDPFEYLNRLRIVASSTNLGDNRTLAIPVAHTIFHEMGPERRASMGIADSLIRISVGIEDCDDLIADFERAFKHNER